MEGLPGFTAGGGQSSTSGARGTATGGLSFGGDHIGSDKTSPTTLLMVGAAVLVVLGGIYLMTRAR